MKRTLILHDGKQSNLRSSDGQVLVRLWDKYPTSFAKTIWHDVQIVVSDITKLQGMVGFVREIGRTARLSISVREAVAISLLHGPFGPVDGRQVISMSRELSAKSTSLRLRIGYHAPVWAFLSSTLSAPLSVPNGLTPSVRVGISRGVESNWLGLAVGANYIHDDGAHEADPENPGPLPRMDLAFVSEELIEQIEPQTGVAGAVAHQAVSVSEARPGWSAAAGTAPRLGAPIETRIFNPIGVLRAPTAGWAYLRPGVGGHSVACGEDGQIVAEFDSVTAGTIASLRNYWGVVDSGAAFTGPAARAEAITRLIASGVPVISPDAGTTLRGWMPLGLLDGIESSRSVVADAESREALVIKQVRSAHRFATWRAADHDVRRAGSYRDPSVSVGIATMRPEYVEHVLRTFESQTWQRKQLLLGLHGFKLSDIPPDARRRIMNIATVVEWPADGIFGDLLRELTLRADGELFAKMDDDDWYAPYHLEDLVYALQYSGATLAGNGVQFVYMHSADITIRRSIEQSYRYGGHPGGPTFVAARDAILRAGNWPRVRRAVDTGLNEAILALGGSIYQSHAHNFLFNRRSSGHTWKATNAYFIEKAKYSWDGIRPPIGFRDEVLPNVEWRSSASSVFPLVLPENLTRTSSPAALQLPSLTPDSPNTSVPAASVV